jgi:hypothetical protein
MWLFKMFVQHKLQELLAAKVISQPGFPKWNEQGISAKLARVLFDQYDQHAHSLHGFLK